MTFLQQVMIVLVALAGTGVVLTRDPLAQAVVVSFFGLVLAVTFFVFHAPDVSLSQVVIGAVALPLMILLALAKIRDEEQRRRRNRGGERT